jgi:hypothetical protein
MRGLSRPQSQEAPGTLVVESLSAIEVESNSVAGGWVSEVTLVGDQLDLVFCDLLNSRST